MKNKKGQSLIEIIFSMGIVILVLTGVVVLIVSTARVKRISLERQRAVGLSQILIENKVLEVKQDTLGFWNQIDSLNGKVFSNNKGSDIGLDFSDYLYDVEYKSCAGKSCIVVFTIKWGDSQSLSVERLFLRQGT